MDFLLFRSLKRQTTDPEEETVVRWRRAAPENETHYRELAALLSLTAAAYHEPDADLASAPRAAELLASERARAPFARRFFSEIGRRLLLAGAVGAVVAAAFMAVLLLQPPPESLSFGAEEFRTGRGHVATVHLRDGTLIRLAPESHLRVTGSLGAREVTLDGRAFFAVANIEGAPFTVRTRAGDAIVLGTRFEAEATGDELRLVVVEGRVALTAAQNRVELGAGETGRAVEGALSAPSKVEDLPAALEWMGNFLIFQQTPVLDVAAEIERHFGVPVEVRGTGLGAQTVTASFVDQDLEDVVRVVCRVLAAVCTLEDGHATVDLTHIAPSHEPRRAVP